MIYKKSQTGTDTPIIISIASFQAFLILCLGFINIDNVTQDVGVSFTIPLIGHVGFVYNIINNISLLGWGNALIFSPLILGGIYIVAKLIRGGG